MITLPHPQAVIRVQERNGKRLVSVDPSPGVFVSTKSWATSYPVELIEHILRIKGPASLCDELRRDEDPTYVEHHLRWDILSYVAPEDFVGKRVLDFGAGVGASTMILARMFPRTAIHAVELVPEYVEVARHRARFYGIEDRIAFELSPSSRELPRDIGQFDFIVFSAVYEHLLPEERRTILPELWRHLKPGGILFLDQTPYRWFPVELHTTGLPLLNYLPASAALFLARRYVQRIRKDESWEELLRRGIRGGTRAGVLENLGQPDAYLLEPSRLGVSDRIDLWYKLSSSTRRPFAKRAMMLAMRVLRAITHVESVPTLSLAILKTQTVHRV